MMSVEFKKLFAVALAVMSAVSCGPKVHSIGQQTIRFVKSILGDKESPEYMVLKSYDPMQHDAAIYVIGDRPSCAFVSNELKNSDDRDNIDGVPGSDGLPDFAGETIAVLADVANGSYDSLVISGKTEVLRELTVRTMLKAVDTLCFLSPFDDVGLGHKSAAKMVVIASPAASAYGYFDVDSLLRASSCRLPVVSPMSKAMEQIVVRDGMTVAVITSKERADAGIYLEICGNAALKSGFTSVKCVVAAPSGKTSSLAEFLDFYIEEGNESPVDALLVDDMVIDSSEYEDEVGKILSVMNAEYLKYSEFLSTDFRIVRSAPIIREECYRILRERNLFTHKVAFPKEESYLNIQRNGISDIMSNIIIEYNSKYLSK